MVSLRYSRADVDKAVEEHGAWLCLGADEEIVFASKTRRDLIIFTNARLVVTDTQGLMRKKTSYESIPFTSIGRWSIESKSGWLDGADLKIWLGHSAEPLLDIELTGDSDGQTVGQLLSESILF